MFLRKSREDVEAERAGKGETLAKHRAALSRLADDMGIEVSRVYEEIVSGGDLSRRADARRMLEDVRAGMWDGVLAFDLQRVTRGDMIDQGTVVLAFQLSRTLIITPQKVYDLRDELDGNFAELEMLFGRMELARITRRLTAGKEEAVRQGQYLGSIAPYGYDKAVVDRKKTLVPNDDAERVESWYRRVADGGATPRKIADEMNDMGIPTPRAGLWDRTLVTKIIRNPVYKGYVRWNGKRTVETFGPDGQKAKVREKADEIIALGLHEPLVDAELWQRAVDAISVRRHATPDDRTLKDPLASLLVCSGCGRSMQRVRDARRDVAYYNHPSVNRKACWQKSTRMDDVVRAVVAALSEAAADVEARIGRVEAPPATDQVERDLAAEERSAETLFRLVEKGIISDEEFADRKRLSDARLAAIRARLEEARLAGNRSGADRELAVSLKRAMAELGDYAGRAEEVNRFLKSFIERIEYEKDPETGVLRLRVLFR